MKTWTLLEKEKQVEDMDPYQKGQTGRRYGPFLERRNKSKIHTFLGKEEQVEDIDSPKKGRIGRRHEPSSDKGG